METNNTELSINELEKANGCGPITGFNNYLLPARKKQNDGNGNEENDQ